MYPSFLALTEITSDRLPGQSVVTRDTARVIRSNSALNKIGCSNWPITFWGAPSFQK